MAKSTTLKVHYLSPSQLVAEYSRSVGKGVVVVPSRQKVALGDVFVLEMRAIGLYDPVAVKSEVAHIQDNPSGDGYLVGLRYTVDKSTSDAVVAIITRLLQLQKFEKQRKSFRVPVNWPGQLHPNNELVKIVDLSKGGMRVCFTARSKLPVECIKGARVLVMLNETAPSIESELVWALDPPGGISMQPPLIGIRFDKIPEAALATLDRMIRLVDFAPAPDQIVLRMLT